MTEISGEFSQRNTENLPKPDHTISKFKKLSGRDNVEPSTLGISPERETDIFNRFEKRAIAETDIPSIVDGIIPPELIFDPDIPDQTMQTEAGPAEIRARGRVYGYIVNKFLAMKQLHI